MNIALIDSSHFSFPYDHHLAEALAQRGHTVYLIGRRYRMNEERPDANYTHCPLFYSISERMRLRIGANRFVTFFKGVEHIIDSVCMVFFIHSLRPDIIHFQWTAFPLIDRIVVALLRAPQVIYTVHDSKQFHGQMTSSIQRWGYTAFLRSVSRYYVHIRFTKDQLEKQGIDASRITVIPHGILHSFCRSTDQNSTNIFNVDKHAIVFFGSIKKYKGVDLLLKACEMLPEIVWASSELVVAGEFRGSKRARRAFEAQCRRSVYCRAYLRRLSECEIDDLLRNASIIVFPYHECDASGAVMRALPFGRPIVASYVGGLQELFDADAGDLLFSPGDGKRLSELLTRLLSNPDAQRRAGDTVQRVLKKIPSWDAIAEQTEMAYRQCIESMQKE